MEQIERRKFLQRAAATFAAGCWRVWMPFAARSHCCQPRPRGCARARRSRRCPGEGALVRASIAERRHGMRQLRPLHRCRGRCVGPVRDISRQTGRCRRLVQCLDQATGLGRTLTAISTDQRRNRMQSELAMMVSGYVVGRVAFVAACVRVKTGETTPNVRLSSLRKKEMKR